MNKYSVGVDAKNMINISFEYESMDDHDYIKSMVLKIESILLDRFNPMIIHSTFKPSPQVKEPGEHISFKPGDTIKMPAGLFTSDQKSPEPKTSQEHLMKGMDLIKEAVDTMISHSNPKSPEPSDDGVVWKCDVCGKMYDKYQGPEHYISIQNGNDYLTCNNELIPYVRPSRLEIVQDKHACVFCNIQDKKYTIDQLRTHLDTTHAKLTGQYFQSEIESLQSQLTTALEALEEIEGLIKTGEFVFVKDADAFADRMFNIAKDALRKIRGEK